jgi:hypothetical protein
LGNIVICGSGRVGRLEALTLIEDYMDSKPDTTWNLLYPLPTGKDESVTPVMAQTCRWTSGKDNVTYSVLWSATDKRAEKADTLVQEMIAGAAEAFDAPDPVKRAIDFLDPKTDVVMLAWDDEDHTCEKALRAAVRREIRVLDLTFGLTDIEWVEDDTEAPEATSEPDPGPPWDEALDIDHTEKMPGEDVTVTRQADGFDYERMKATLEPFVDYVVDLIFAEMERRMA